MLETGKRAPAFTLPTDGDDKFQLTAHKGQMVVLFFYPKDNTSGCTKEAIGFTEKLRSFKSRDAVIVGISPDSVKSHVKFRKDHKLKVILASDEDKKVLEKYGVWVQKSMYGRKYMGVERTTVLIDQNGKMARIWNKVKVPGHVEEVLEAVKELKASQK